MIERFSITGEKFLSEFVTVDGNVTMTLYPMFDPDMKMHKSDEMIEFLESMRKELLDIEMSIRYGAASRMIPDEPRKDDNDEQI